MSKANRIYTILLLVLAFFLIAGIGEIQFLKHIVANNASTPQAKSTIQWVFNLTAFIEGIYVVAIVATLILRQKTPQAGELATKALNIILLVLFPIGTALGIYGLIKVDRQDGPQGFPVIPPRG